MSEPVYYDPSGRPYTVRDGVSVWLTEPVYHDAAGRPYTVRNGVSVWLEPDSRAMAPGAQPELNSEAYLFSLVDGIQSRERSAGFAALTPAEQVFFSVWALEAEVNNGGFGQYYSNDAGDLALLAPGHLRSIGAEHTAAIVERANAVFGPDGPPVDRGDRQDLLNGLPDERRNELEGCDSAFLVYEDDLSELLAAFMRAAGQR